MENLQNIDFAPDLWLLRVTDLKQFEYCPRIVYYQYCLPGIRPTTYKMAAGIAEQDRVAGLEERRSLRAYGVKVGERHFNVSVTSSQLSLSGQIDLVIETIDGDRHRLMPIDFKLSRQEPGRHFKLQLACYALLLEEQWALPVETGAIYLIPLKKVVKVPMTQRLRNDALHHIAEIRTQIMAQRVPPPTSQRSRCVNCEFHRFCNDVI